MNNHEEGTKPVKYLFLIPLLAELGASVFAIIALVRLNILQAWLLVLVIGLLVLIFALNIYLLLIRKKKGVASKVFATILALVVAGGCYFGATYATSATNFLSEITREQVEVQVYEVRVHKNSGITSLDTLAGRKIGFLANNPNLEETKTKLREKLEPFDAVDYEEIGTMFANLYDNELPAVVLPRSYLSFLEEADSTFENDTVVLYSMEIVVKDLDLRQPVNVIEEPFIVYISGSDSRGTINEVADSDVNILAVVNPEKGKILLVNVPRDYEIQIYGTTGLTDKLKSAGLFGIETSVKTIEELLDVKINYTVKVGFQSVRELVDAIDGIDIESTQALTIMAGDESPNSPERKYCYIQEGANHLDGACALRYARERVKFKEGDLDRGKHQQDVLTAIINKIMDVHYVTRLPQILDAAKDTFQTSFKETEITDFIRWQLSELKRWKVESIQIGTSAHVLKPTHTFRNQNMWLYLRDEASETKAKEKIAEYLAK